MTPHDAARHAWAAHQRMAASGMHECASDCPLPPDTESPAVSLVVVAVAVMLAGLAFAVAAFGWPALAGLVVYLVVGTTVVLHLFGFTPADLQ